jgi:hypothetical protein
MYLFLRTFSSYDGCEEVSGAFSMPRVIAGLSRAIQRVSAVVVVCLASASPAVASITGVCPDGSIFIVSRSELVPCRDAKTVDPTRVPPIRPEYLPRPYGWEVFNRQSDPNNPYNLIQSLPAPEPAPESAASQPTQNRQGEHRAPSGVSAPEAALRNHAAVRSAAETASLPGEPALRLEDAEADDLAMIVELSQRRAPASFLADESRGRLRLARSAAFEKRMREQLSQRGGSSQGPVVLFMADAESGGSFHGNLTFVQSGVAFHPSTDDPLQLGMIRGRLGPIEEGGRVLGYIVLPEHLDLAHPIDIYWNDRLVTATLQP